jgi:hypothetical protein
MRRRPNAARASILPGLMISPILSCSFLPGLWLMAVSLTRKAAQSGLTICGTLRFAAGFVVGAL